MNLQIFWLPGKVLQMALKQFNEFMKQFSDFLPPIQEGTKRELLEQFHHALTIALEKLNVVTRQEFDIQAELLSRTYEKLAMLEQRIADLEQQLLFNSSESHNNNYPKT